jgi:anti-sigma regulatory factor (Ser/Thr protein kinase)
VRAPRSGARRTLAELSMPSEPGNERRAMEEVAAAVGGLELAGPTLERLKTAVAEATMNAMEHGNPSRLGPFRYEEVELQKVCTNPKLQWSRVGTCWHNASARS